MPSLAVPGQSVALGQLFPCSQYRVTNSPYSPSFYQKDKQTKLESLTKSILCRILEELGKENVVTL